MIQKIVLAPSIEGSDYLKSQSSLGVNPKETFGVRIFHTIELARYLMQCSGVSCSKEFITNLSLAGKLYHETKKINYFKDYSFLDVFNLINSLSEFRKCIPCDEAREIQKLKTTQTFKEKNDAIIAFYKLLVELLNKENLIDEIGLIRFAIENSQPIQNANFEMYDELDYTKLDEALLEKASGKNINHVHLFNNQKPNIKSYTKAFGQNSEIEDILAYIYENNIPFDKCLIAASDVNTYGKILSNYQAVLNIPLIVNSGQSISDTSSGRLFGSICSWMNNRYHLDYLVELLYSREFNLEQFKEDIGYNQSEADTINQQHNLKYYDVFSFDLIVNTTGNLKIGFEDNKKNEERIEAYQQLLNKKSSEDANDNLTKRDLIVLEYVKKIKDIFKQGLAQFLEKYLVIDKDNEAVERNALEKYVDALSICNQYDIPLVEIIKYLAHVSIGNRKPTPGSLFVTSIGNAASFLRENLFVVGLDSKTFPGKVSEDPIFLDQDYDLLGIKNASFKKMNDNKKSYHNLINLATSLKKVNIHLSYAYYNSETAKAQNSSSVFFETYRNENGMTKTIKDLNDDFATNTNKYRTAEFFDNTLFPLSILGQKSKNSVPVAPKTVIDSQTKNVDATSLISKRGLSATAIETFIDCHYKFFLSVLLKIEQENETNIYEIIPANDLGTIAHDLMENFDDKEAKQQFLAKAEGKFREYLISHPSDNPQAEDAAINDFLNMMANGYDMEVADGLKSALREKDLFATHSSGLKIHGFPDKVARISKDVYRVIDYKTKNSVSHNVKDAGSLVQGALYSYVLMHGENYLNYKGSKNISVESFVFRYLKLKKDVSSSDGGHDINEYLAYLDNILNEIAACLKTGEFDKSGNCDSCFYKSVCGGKKL